MRSREQPQKPQFHFLTEGRLTILGILSSTIKELFRSTTYRILVAIISVYIQTYFVLLLIFELEYAARSPTLGFNSTIFIFGEIEPFFFLIAQISSLILTYYALQRIHGNNTNEVIQYRAVGSSSLYSGTIIGVSLAILLIVISNFLFIIVFYFVTNTININLSSKPDFVSFVNAIAIDLPITISFWSVIMLLISSILKNRTIALLILIGTATALYFLSEVAPYSWKSLLSSTSNSVIVGSEIDPRGISGWTLVNRVSILLLLFGIIFMGRLYPTRIEPFLRKNVTLGISSCAIGIFGILGHTWSISQATNHREFLSSKHDSFQDLPVLDLEVITGTVHIDPGHQLSFNLELYLRIPDQYDLPYFLFSLNPGMSIDVLAIDGQNTAFDFEHGILSVRPESTSSKGRNVVMSISANGLPDVSFGYFDPLEDYLNSIGSSSNKTRLLGLHNALFSRNYVALLPGLRWYPVPGSLAVSRQTQELLHSPDLYEVRLDVTLDNHRWRLGGPGARKHVDHDVNAFSLRPSQPVPHIAIVAGEFVEYGMSVRGIEFRLLLHERHVHTTKALGLVLPQLRRFIHDRLEKLESLGIMDFPYASLTLAEVPKHLRMAGGYNMPFLYSMPGLILLREDGFPTARFDYALDRITNPDRTKEEVSARFFRHLQEYDESNIIGGSILEAFAAQYYPHIFQESDTDSVAINFLRRIMLSDGLRDSEQNYMTMDIGLVTDVAELTSVNLFPALARIYRYHDIDPARLRDEQYNRLLRQEITKITENVSLRELQTVKRQDLVKSVLFAKVSLLYQALIDLHGKESIYNILFPTEDRFEGKITIEKLYHLVEFNQIELSEILREWLVSDGCPGFFASDFELSMIQPPNGDLLYKASFVFGNDQDTVGTVLFNVETEDDYKRIEPAIEISPRTAHRVNLYSERPILGVIANTYHSLNKLGIVVRHTASTTVNTDVQDEEVLPMLTPISWTNSTSAIIIDNLDDGFSIIGGGEQCEKSVWDNLNWFWERPTLPPLCINGMESMDLLSTSRNTLWRHAEIWKTYGRYNQSTAVTYGKNPGTARFSMDVSSASQWELSYYFPFRYGSREHYGKYNFVLNNGEHRHAFSVNAEGRHGWVRLGTFKLNKPVAHVDLVSVEPSDSIRVADAVRWVQTD